MRYLEEKELITPAQAGFRAKRNSMDQVTLLVQKMADGFQRKESTLAVFLDFKQAYDRVWRPGLLLKLQRLGVTSNMYRWISGFLAERTVATRFGKAISRKRTLEQGLPQGSALSCTLFLAFINDLPNYLGCSNLLFADDLVIWKTGRDATALVRSLQQDLSITSCFAKMWGLEVNCLKTVYSLFTLGIDILKEPIRLKIGDQVLRNDPKPVYLGVTLDRKLSMYDHVRIVRENASSKLNILKRLASTSWGAKANVLRTLYLEAVRSQID